MCFEDIKLGRQKRVAIRQFNSGTAPDNQIPASPSRVGICFATTAGGIISVVPKNMTVGVSASFPISGTVPPLYFDIEQYGNLVTGAWETSGIGGAPDILLTEIFLERFQ